MQAVECNTPATQTDAGYGFRIQAENMQAAESQIFDVDVAQEMISFVRSQILTQAAMLAQAKSLPKMVMQLMG